MEFLIFAVLIIYLADKLLQPSFSITKKQKDEMVFMLQRLSTFIEYCENHKDEMNDGMRKEFDNLSTDMEKTIK